MTSGHPKSQGLQCLRENTPPAVGQHPRRAEGPQPHSAPLVGRVRARRPFQGSPALAPVCTVFGPFLLSTKARTQIQTTPEMRCPPCFSAVKGKELSQAVFLRHFTFFLSTARIVSPGSSIYRCLPQLAAPYTRTVNGKLCEKRCWLPTQPATERQTHRRFQVIFFFSC